MYIRRPLCLFGILFAAVLTVILHLSGEKDVLSGKESTLDGRHKVFEGTVRGIEEKNNRLIVQIGHIILSKRRSKNKRQAAYRNKSQGGRHIPADGRGGQQRTV